MAELTVVNKLSQEERFALRECEAAISQGLKGLSEMLIAFYRIREGRLYREKFATFEDYCREEFDITKRAGNQRASAGGLTLEFIELGFEQLPNEYQARLLQPLQPALRRAAWTEALGGDEPVTGKTVEAAITRVKQAKTPGAVVKLENAFAPDQARVLGQEGIVESCDRDGLLNVAFKEGDSQVTLKMLPGQVSVITPGIPPEPKPKKLKPDYKALLQQCLVYQKSGEAWPAEFMQAVSEACG